MQNFNSLRELQNLSSLDSVLNQLVRVGDRLWLVEQVGNQVVLSNVGNGSDVVLRHG